MIKFVKVFKVRIVYKSGYTHDFETTAFSVKGSSYTWDNYSTNNKPVQLGVDDIAAVWQLGYRTEIRFGK